MPDRTIARELARESISRGDPTGWFEKLYALGEKHPEVVPWGNEGVNPHLLSWSEKKGGVYGKGKTALVVGCGYGYDAEWLSGRGFQVLAFDISPTAINSARRRFPSSSVNYQVADAVNIPKPWEGMFDFVFEAYTLQVLQAEARRTVRRNIASMVRESLLLICRGRDEHDDMGLMPWPLTKNELLEISLLRPDLNLISIEDFLDSEEDPPVRRFRAEYAVRA